MIEAATPARSSHLAVHPSPSYCECWQLRSHRCSLLWITVLGQKGYAPKRLMPWKPLASDWGGYKRPGSFSPGGTCCVCSITAPVSPARCGLWLRLIMFFLISTSPPYYSSFPTLLLRTGLQKPQAQNSDTSL